MTIEENLGRIATALETIAASAAAAPVAGAKTDAGEKPPRRRSARKEEAPKVETPDPPSLETPTVTRDQVREALRIFRKDHSKDDAIAILGKFKAKSITAAEESILPALLEAFTA